jgi:hypothetical protein
MQCAAIAQNHQQFPHGPENRSAEADAFGADAFESFLKI